MDMDVLCKGICLQREVYARVRDFFACGEFSRLEALSEALTVMETSRDAYKALSEILGEEDTAMLACNLYGAVKVHERYVSQGIPDAVFFDTMKCFTRFLEETRRNTGVYKFDRAFWTYRQLRMSLFRIGELEYEILPEEHAVSLHIPSDARFTPEAVDASLAAARDFLKQHYPQCGDYTFLCHSWLLSPELEKLLPETSNILGFQHRFTILSVQPEEKEFLQWVFGAAEDTPAEMLSEKTSLQRNVKALLLRGGNIGAARGIMKEKYTIKEKEYV